MRTLFIVNSLTNTYPTAKGALAVKLRDAFIADAAGLAATRKMVKGVDKTIDLINSLGNGSVKTFTINPFNVWQVSEESGATANVTPKYSITYPTGNARTDSFGNQFQGGIVVKQLDKAKNVYNTKKIINVEVLGTNGSVANSDVVVAFKAAMATITGAGKYITSATPDASPAVFNLGSDDIYIELVGDLRWFSLKRTNGMVYTISGADVALMERELAPNSGFIESDSDSDLYEKSNFIADKTATYNFITLTSMMDAERPLLPNAAGFPKTLHIAFLDGTMDTEFANFKTFIDELQHDPADIA